MFSSSIFKPEFKDGCLWRLSIQAATDENTWVKTLPNDYNYSFATSDTFAARDVCLLMQDAVTKPADDAHHHETNGDLHYQSLRTRQWTLDRSAGERVPSIPLGKDLTGDLVALDGTASQKVKWRRLDHMAIIGITLHTQSSDLYFWANCQAFIATQRGYWLALSDV